MFRSKENKEQERFYLLPGQGGRAARRKHFFFLKLAILAALAFSGLLALMMYWLDRPSL